MDEHCAALLPRLLRRIAPFNAFTISGVVVVPSSVGNPSHKPRAAVIAHVCPILLECLEKGGGLRIGKNWRWRDCGWAWDCWGL